MSPAGHRALRRKPDRRSGAAPPSPGFTYIALLAAIVIIGISMAAAGRYWQHVLLREKEEELLFRGDQYRMAIERYYSAIPGKAQLPQSLDDLLSDSRTAKGTRHLRQKYPDPMTGGDFDVLRDQARGNRITGVCSTSNREPLRKTDFPDPYQEFEGKKTYKDWKFLFVPKQPAAPPVKPPAPP